MTIIERVAFGAEDGAKFLASTMVWINIKELSRNKLASTNDYKTRCLSRTCSLTGHSTIC